MSSTTSKLRHRKQNGRMKGKVNQKQVAQHHHGARALSGYRWVEITALEKMTGKKSSLTLITL